MQFVTPEWLRDLVARLTDLHECSREAPWAITDAPADYIDRNLRAIVGVELVVDRLEAKLKLSQNRSADDIAGVVSGLAGGNADERTVAGDMQRASEARAEQGPARITRR